MFRNCTVTMFLLAWTQYINAVIPGCIGAGALQRLPASVQRSLLLCFVVLLPNWCLQLFSGMVMRGVGFAPEIAGMVQQYTRYSVLTSALLCTNMHLEAMLVNLRYVWSVSVISAVTGVVVQVGAAFLLISVLNLGAVGAVLAEAVVEATRLILLISCVLFFGLQRYFLVSAAEGQRPAGEPLLGRHDVCEFFSMGVPSILRNFAGWFIFELQIVVLVNIKGLPLAALAAGAMWVSAETASCSSQEGWLRVIKMRTLELLGAKDPGAWEGFVITNALSFAVVAAGCAVMLHFQGEISALLTSDPEVRHWFGLSLWVLAFHSVMHLLYVNATSLLVPLGHYKMSVLSVVLPFYGVALPVMLLVCLSDLVTTNLTVKVLACLGASSLALATVAVTGYLYVGCWMDWSKASSMVHDRAAKGTDGDEEQDDAAGMRAEQHVHA